MGFFKDFKDDFSQAVNELMPGEDNLEDGAANEDLVVTHWKMKLMLNLNFPN